MMRIAATAFAVTLIALGVIGLVDRDYLPLWQLPDFVPSALGYLCSAVSIGCGVGLLVPRIATNAARVLLAYLVLWNLVCCGYAVAVAPTDLGSWYGPAEAGVIVAAALVLSQTGLRIARVIYGLAMIPFGLGHFVYLERTASLVPSFLPAHVFLAHATGVAFFAAGLAMLTGVLARVAAMLSALQLSLFTPVVWIPVIAAGEMNAFEWGELGATIALAAGAWVVAASYRDA
jgi:uncharacterized membrane protein